MLHKINANMDHYARHLVTVSLVVFLFIVNLLVYDYASAATGSSVDQEVSSKVNYTAQVYSDSSDYMYEYSVTWGELLLGWEDFIVDTYLLVY